MQRTLTDLRGSIALVEEQREAFEAQAREAQRALDSAAGRHRMALEHQERVHHIALRRTEQRLQARGAAVDAPATPAKPNGSTAKDPMVWLPVLDRVSSLLARFGGGAGAEEPVDDGGSG